MESPSTWATSTGPWSRREPATRSYILILCRFITLHLGDRPPGGGTQPYSYGVEKEGGGDVEDTPLQSDQEKEVGRR